MKTRTDIASGQQVAVVDDTLAAWRDFVLLAIWAGLLAVLFITGITGGPLVVLRVVLGLGWVLLAPGYALCAVLFPAARDLEWTARLGASVGLSVALVPLLALVLDWLPWGLNPWPILVLEFLFTAICAGIAVWRRGRLPAGEALDWSGDAFRPLLNDMLASGNRRLNLAIIVAALFAVAALWLFLAPPPATVDSTFYILGSAGQARDYPRSAAPGQTLTLTLGVTNGDPTQHLYRVEAWAENPLASDSRTKVADNEMMLAAGQKSEAPLSWTMPQDSNQSQVEFLLFIDNGAEPARRLLLPLDETP